MAGRGRPRKYPKSAFEIPGAFLFYMRDEMGLEAPEVLMTHQNRVLIDGADPYLGHLLDEAHLYLEDPHRDSKLARSAKYTINTIYQHFGIS